MTKAALSSRVTHTGYSHGIPIQGHQYGTNATIKHGIRIQDTSQGPDRIVAGADGVVAVFLQCFHPAFVGAIDGCGAQRTVGMVYTPALELGGDAVQLRVVCPTV